MAKKKKAKPVNDRVAEHRKRMTDCGYRQVNVTLQIGDIILLDRLAKNGDLSRSQVVSRLIRDASKKN